LTSRLTQVSGRRKFDRERSTSFFDAVRARLTGKHGTPPMAFKIETTSRDDTTGTKVHTVVVTIDDHETVLSFESKEAAERFAETERARLTADEQLARSAPRT
jgi:hypothetical protein